MNDDVSKIFLGPLSLFLSLSLSSVFHLLLAIPRLLSMHNHPTFFFVFFFFTSSFSTSLPAYSRFFFSNHGHRRYSLCFSLFFLPFLFNRNRLLHWGSDLLRLFDVFACLFKSLVLLQNGSASVLHFGYCSLILFPG